jgi:phosphoribosylaminoimidazole-succinocarboxamide synthase
MNDCKVLVETNIPSIPLLRRGKVRDVYDMGDCLLMIATDRISAFDCILPNGIHEKGKILTSLSFFWFDFLSDVTKNHLISANVDEYPESLQQYRDQLEGRSMLVKKAEVVPIECIVRGYLSGSGWRDYSKGQDVGGANLPNGIEENERIPDPFYPLFSPSTKEDEGHDINISYEKVCELQGEELAIKLRDTAVAIYRSAAAYSLKQGVILADTKFEFGIHDGKLILIDEVLTPDSSRFWLASQYLPGQMQKPYDKQYVRDYLMNLDWDRTPPAPKLPDEVIDKTNQRYREAYKLITGKDFRS